MPEVVEVFEAGDAGRWRWLYRDSEAEVELRSSATYASADEAERAAVGMYPQARVEVRPSPPGPAEGQVPEGGLLRALGPLAALGALIAYLWSRGRRRG
jgi:hypothetical protein